MGADMLRMVDAMAMTITAAISPYSKAVTPRWSAKTARIVRARRTMERNFSLMPGNPLSRHRDAHLREHDNARVRK
jgi:hypothetical protein